MDYKSQTPRHMQLSSSEAALDGPTAVMTPDGSDDANTALRPLTIKAYWTFCSLGPKRRPPAVQFRAVSSSAIICRAKSASNSVFNSVPFQVV